MGNVSDNTQSTDGKAFGKSLMDGGAFRAAIGWFTTMIADEPNDASLYHSRAVAYAILSIFEHALTDFTKAIELVPTDAMYFCDRGTCHEQMGQYGLARADFSKCIELDPNWAYPYSKRAASALDSGDLIFGYDLEQILGDINKALELDPNELGALINRAAIYDRQGRLKMAIADFERALALEPNMPMIAQNLAGVRKRLIDFAHLSENVLIEMYSHFHKGMFYYEQGLASSAVEEFDLSIAAYPEFVDAYQKRALAYIELRHPDLALADFATAIRLSPDFAGAYLNRGTLLMRLFRVDEAIVDFHKALTIEPSYELAARHLARALTLHSKM